MLVNSILNVTSLLSSQASIRARVLVYYGVFTFVYSCDVHVYTTLLVWFSEINPTHFKVNLGRIFAR